MAEALLFPTLPRSRPRIVRMHVVDAGMPVERNCHVRLKCATCGYDDGWSVRSETLTELRRGLPCPRCNPPPYNSPPRGG